ncbi:pyrimidine 5'-nucleotidase [Actinobacillus delphinicola]|uniref:Nucleotidase n=1 Tax=Actinobacillus delphinicola TaxID=51161 RepID=A0A448TSL9_9PAST|nr:pyrimidine 5'-nucleotidase [Actinobacillus delphinicola]VEJ08916.1 nucleotidase [Actinobacillus delphinicola]
MKYKWILFDADQTLFSFSSYQGLVNVCAKYGMDFTKQDFEEYENINQPLWLQYQQQKIDVNQLKCYRFQNLSKKIGIDPLQINAELMDQMATLSPAYRETIPMLEKLHGKVNMGIITNGFASMQQARLDFTKTAKFFDLLIISEEVGVPKPQTGIFSAAFDQIQQRFPVQKSQILMVGDSLSSDIAGGNAFGFDTCWLNQHQQTSPEHIKPTFEITNISDLVNIVM